MADEFGYVMNIYHNSAQNVRRKMGTIDNNEMLHNIHEKSGTSNLMYVMNPTIYRLELP